MLFFFFNFFLTRICFFVTCPYGLWFCPMELWRKTRVLLLGDSHTNIWRQLSFLLGFSSYAHETSPSHDMMISSVLTCPSLDLFQFINVIINILDFVAPNDIIGKGVAWAKLWLSPLFWVLAWVLAKAAQVCNLFYALCSCWWFSQTKTINLFHLSSSFPDSCALGIIGQD